MCRPSTHMVTLHYTVRLRETPFRCALNRMGMYILVRRSVSRNTYTSNTQAGSYKPIKVKKMHDGPALVVVSMLAADSHTRIQSFKLSREKTKGRGSGG